MEFVLNYWYFLSLFCFKNIVYDIFKMESHFLRAHSVCLVYLQEIKMRLIGGNYECIYWIHSPQTDLTSMKMTKNVSPFSFYLFLRFFIAVTIKWFLVVCSRRRWTYAFRLLWGWWKRALILISFPSAALPVLQRWSWEHCLCVLSQSGEEFCSFLSPWTLNHLFCCLIVTNTPSTSHLHHSTRKLKWTWEQLHGLTNEVVGGQQMKRKWRS